MRQFFSWLLLRLRQVFVSVIRQLVPYAFAYQNSWTFRRRILDESATTDLRADMERCMAIDVADLKESHQLELARREQLRKQAQLNLGASALAATLALGLVKNDTFPMHDHCIIAGISIFAILSLVLSALSALAANDTMPTHDMWLQLRRFSFGRPTLVDDHKAKLIKATYLNQGGNLIVQNYAEASSVSMRNAIVAVGVVLVSVIVGGRLTLKHEDAAKVGECTEFESLENRSSPNSLHQTVPAMPAESPPSEVTAVGGYPVNTLEQVIAEARIRLKSSEVAPIPRSKLPMIYVETIPAPNCRLVPRVR